MKRGVVYFFQDSVPSGRFMAELQLEPDGVYTAIIQDQDDEEWITAKQSAELLASHGIKLHFKTIYRLADEGQIRDCRPLSHTRQFGRASILRFVSRIKADPEHWAKSFREASAPTSGKPSRRR